MDFNSGLPSMDNIPSWAQMQYLQQIAISGYQQLLLGQYLASGGNPSILPSSYGSIQDDSPESKRRRIDDIDAEIVDVSTVSPTSASNVVSPPTPSPSCSSASNDDGHGSVKGVFHDLLLSPTKLKIEEPQFESPLKAVIEHHSSYNHHEEYPDVLDLSCKPSRRQEPIPMVMLPRSSFNNYTNPFRNDYQPRDHHKEIKYSETQSAPTKSPIVIDLSDKQQSWKVLQNLHLNFKSDTIDIKYQNEVGPANVLPIKTESTITISPVVPSITPEALSVGNSLTITVADGVNNSERFPVSNLKKSNELADGIETSTSNVGGARPRGRPGKGNTQCHICHKVYENSYKLKLHTYTHTGERPFTCDICGKGFSRGPNLIAHRRVHSGVKPFSCTRGCGRFFSHPSDRLVHVVTEVCTRLARLLKPLEEGGWQCTQCGRQMKEQGHAERHARQHEAGVGLICSECGVNFQGLKAHTLVKHMRELHPEYLKRQGL